MKSNPLRIGVLGSGSGSNCEAILQASEAGQISSKVAIVVSDNADAFILQRARQRGIRAEWIGPSQFKTKLEPELEAKVAAWLREESVDLVLLAGYMRVVKSPLLSVFPGKVMNVHPSLLPAFPGLRAWEQAIRYGVRVSGCTVHFVNEGVDTGPIILQEAVPVRHGDTPESLHKRIQEAEHRLYPEAVRLYEQGRLRIEGRSVVVAATA